MKNYLTYPCKVMRITQSYTGTTSHKPHTTGSPKDYPWDEGCADSGRGKCYCPCDEMKVKRIYGTGGSGTNTLWLESTSKVIFADGTEDFCTMLITHPNDDDLKKIEVGDTFKRGKKICREGKDGATAYHFHFSAGKGKFKGTGWIKNNKGKYVLTTTGGTFKPERLFFIDKSFTTVKNAKGLNFVELPKKAVYTVGNYEVTKASVLRVRKGPGNNYSIIKHEGLTKNARSKIVKLAGYEADGYVNGLIFTVSQIKSNWGKTPSGWVCLDYCEKR